MIIVLVSVYNAADNNRTQKQASCFMQKYGFLMIVLSVLGIAGALASAQPDDPSCDITGPTLHLEYTSEQLANSVDSFMYFVPLNSLTAVSALTDPNTNFSAGIINWDCTNFRNKSFTLTCDFEVSGSGLYKVVYDPAEMISLVSRNSVKDKKITGLLDWIQFDGPCLGRIEARGRNQGDGAVIEEVSIRFNQGRQRSPVTIALYDVPRVDNRYDYSNRQNSVVARVNTLTFKRTEEEPRMSVEIASVQKAHQSEGLFSSITAMFANLLLSAQPVSMVGNQTMLEFGLALYHKKTAFTFPIAGTLRSTLKTVHVSAL